MIQYQFIKDIHTPIVEFIDTFNKAYPQDKISLTPVESIRYELINVNINLISEKRIKITLRPILEKDFFRKRTYREFGEIYSRMELQIPEYRGRRIKAWGGLYVDKKGFNIILLENKHELYGEWLILENTNSGLSNNCRAEPFAFELDELEKEIRHVTSMHIYNTEVEEFNIEKFMTYISMYNI